MELLHHKTDAHSTRINHVHLPIHNSYLCDFCCVPQLAYWEIWRKKNRYDWQLYHACDRCADGWREISDRSQQNVI